MHKGEFVGINAANQRKRILILGESHHTSNDENSPNRIVGVEATYDTKDVLAEYFADPELRNRHLRFFRNIAKCFGEFSTLSKEREAFWNNVYFGNYIDVLCGVRDTVALMQINTKGNRKKYNSQLFSFIQENEIDVIFCFSRKVYNKLPSLEAFDKETKGDIGDSHRLDMCEYYPGPRKGISVSLSKPVIVYGLKHPSQGFSHRRYQGIIAEIIKNEGLFNAAD